ncbi:hypothetical protein KY361_05105 [Candidatus Woesearchaeota archaeon]|nr:hypothetical protein [Candidatus Woesearchaeota archaeon]
MSDEDENPWELDFPSEDALERSIGRSFYTFSEIEELVEEGRIRGEFGAYRILEEMCPEKAEDAGRRAYLLARIQFGHFKNYGRAVREINAALEACPDDGEYRRFRSNIVAYHTWSRIWGIVKRPFKYLAEVASIPAYVGWSLYLHFSGSGKKSTERKSEAKLDDIT